MCKYLKNLYKNGLLKSIRHKCALSQQEMATLPGLSSNHYAMVKCGKRMLPAEQAQLLPELLPLWNSLVALPEWPDTLPNEVIDPCKELWLQAKQALFEADEALQTCEKAVQQKQAKADLLSVNAQITGFTAALEALPDGEEKENMRNRLRRLNDRKENLEERIGKSGDMGLLLMQMQRGLAEK